MYSVYDYGLKTTETYNYVEDILRDIITDDNVEDWINDMYPFADVEGFKFPVGTIYRHCGTKEFWNDIVEDFIRCESEWIEEELTSDGEWEGYGIKITDLDIMNEEN